MESNNNEKTSEDLVFEKLKYPSVRQLFAQQILERHTDIDKFLLWYIIEYEPKSIRVEKCTIEELNTQFAKLEYTGMQGSMPRFKNRT